MEGKEGRMYSKEGTGKEPQLYEGKEKMEDCTIRLLLLLLLLLLLFVINVNT